ncbi:hypothetical protein D3C80_1897820 [compost metagenome]
MHHQVLARAAIGAVIGVGETDVEREIIARIRIHLGGADVVETFRRLTVTLDIFRPELARPFADVVGRDLVVLAVVLLLPDLECAFFLENAYHDWRGAGHALRLHLGNDFLGKRLLGPEA